MENIPVDSRPPFSASDLLVRCMGNLDFLQRTLTKFQTRAQSDVNKLAELIEAGDGEQATRLAHSIKGVGATLSATEMQRVAHDIESLGRADRIIEAARFIPELRTEVTRCVDYIPQAIASLSLPSSGHRKAV